MDLFSIVGKITVNASEAIKGIDEVSSKGKSLADHLGKNIQDAGQKISSVGKSLAPVSAAVGGVLIASTKSASTFTDGMAKMSTLFDTTKVNVGKLSKEFLGLSNETGKSATELAEAGYQALSASVPVEKLGKFIKTSADLAKVGFTSTATSVDVMTTAINAYGMETEDADKIANNLVKTQNLGKTTVDELASSMGKIIPTASSMGVNLDNLCTAYTLLTKQGIATAEATTYANSMLNEMGDSGTTVGGILKDKTGKSFQELMAEGNSLGDVLTILQDYAAETGTNFNELWGSSEAGKAAIALLNGGADEFNSTLGQMADSTDVLGEGLEKLDTPSAKIWKALNRVKNTGIELGTAFLSALAPTIEKVVNGVEKATKWFNGLSDGTKTTIATVMALVAGLSPFLIVGGKVIAGIGSFVKVIPTVIGGISTVAGFLTGTIIPGIAAVVAAIGWIPIAIAAVIGVIVLLWNKCEWFRDAVLAVWEAIKEFFTSFIETIGSALSDAWEAIVSAFESVVQWFQGTWETIKGIFGQIADGFRSVWESVTNLFISVAEATSVAWEGIKNAVQVGLMFIAELISAAFQWITLPYRFIWENCKDIIFAAWEYMKTAVSNALSAISGAIMNVWSGISSFLAMVFGVIENVASNAWNGIKSVITAALNFIQSIVTNVMNIVKNVFVNIWSGITSVIGNAVTGIKNVLSNGLNAAKNIVTSILGAIKNAFINILGGAANIVKNAIDKIKSFFKFDWELPKLKLPHLNISGKFSLSPPSVPSFGIDWYKKAMDDGMIMNQPTIFGFNPKTNDFLAGGEAGSETVVGTGSLMEMIRIAVAEENAAMLGKLNQMASLIEYYFPEMLKAMKKAIILDSGVLVGELAPELDAELGKIYIREGR